MPHAIDHPALLERVAAARGGGAHTAFKSFDPARTAHVIVDLQNGFMEEGAPVEVPEARSIVGNVNLISRAVRRAGGINVFLRYTTTDLDEGWSIMRRRLGPGATAHADGFMRDAHYWQLWADLEVSEEDLMVEKSRFSALVTGSSDLHELLQKRDIDTLLITGTLTNCCCESTARDAMQLNYHAVVVADACAALSDAEHEASLYSLGFIFADLTTTDDLLAHLARTKENAA